MLNTLAPDAEHPLLEVRDLVVSFARERRLIRPQRTFRAVDGVGFSLPARTTLGVVGESGSGKSTLARAIVGLAELSAGIIRFDGVDVGRARGSIRRRLRREVQLVFQDASGSLNPRMKVADAVTEPLRIHRLIRRRQASSKAAELLTLVGLDPGVAHRYPHEFSGGQRQRIGIARALSVRPRLLILDEPVSALDVSVAAQVLNTLADLREQFGLTYLFIAHNLAVVERFCDRIVVMHQGRIVEAGPARELCAQATHPYTLSLLAAIPGAKTRRDSQSPIAAGA